MDSELPFPLSFQQPGDALFKTCIKSSSTPLVKHREEGWAKVSRTYLVFSELLRCNFGSYNLSKSLVSGLPLNAGMICKFALETQEIPTVAFMD